MELTKIQIGTKERKLKVIDVKTELLPNQSTKVVFTVIDERGEHKLLISDACIEHPRKGKVIKALYLTLDYDENIICSSTLGKVLQHYKCTSPFELINQYVQVTADPRDYLIIVAY